MCVCMYNHMGAFLPLCCMHACMDVLKKQLLMTHKVACNRLCFYSVCNVQCAVCFELFSCSDHHITSVLLCDVCVNK